jgi:abhydrolase domain-containing protein 6
MTTSEWIRAAIMAAIVIALILKKNKGFLKYLAERKEDKQKVAANERKAERKQSKRTQQVRQIQEKKLQTEQILKTSLGGGFDLKNVEVAGQTLHYFEAGRGPTSVLLLHGFGSIKENWGRFAKNLMHEGYHVVAVDLPGFGQNKKDPELAYDVMSQAKRIRAFTERIGLHNFHVIGNSLGATIAATYTYGYSQDIETLTLIEPLCFRVPEESELDKLEKMGRNPFGIVTPEAYDNLLGFLYAQPPEISDAVKRLHAEDAVKNRDFYLKMWREVRSGEKAYILDMLLPEIDKKTLILHGGQSRVIHPMTAESMQRVLKVPGKAHVAVMEGCGHLPAVEKPEMVVGYWLSFLGA